MARTRIVVTIGPASSSDATILQLIDAGAGVFRLNFAHGTREEHGSAIDRIRRMAKNQAQRLAPRDLIDQSGGA